MNAHPHGFDGIVGGKRPGSGRHPLLLTQPDVAVWVKQGIVDLFLQQVEQGRVRGNRYPVARIEAGNLLFCPDSGIRVGDLEIGLVAVPSADAELLEAPVADFQQKDPRLLGQKANHWVQTIFGVNQRNQTGWTEKLIELTPCQELSTHSPYYGSPSQLVWLKISSGHVVVDQELVLRPEAPPFPIPYGMPVRAMETSQVIGLNGEDIAIKGRLKESLNMFHRAFMTAQTRAWQHRLHEAELHRLNSLANDQQALNRGFGRLAGAIGEHAIREQKKEHAIDAAVRRICRYLDTEFVACEHNHGQEFRDDRQHLLQLLQRSHLRWRPITLAGQWWREDCGPFLAWRGPERQAVALIPHKRDGYRILTDDEFGLPVIEHTVEELQFDAVQIYRPLPAEITRLRDIWRWSLKGLGGDLMRLILCGLASAMLALGLPLIMGILVDDVIPFGDRLPLTHLIIGMVLLVLGSVAFEAVRSLAMVRMEARIDSALQSGLFDRLLSIPARFFRQFSVGELSDRLLGMAAIRDNISGPSLAALISAAFGICSLALLYYFHVGLAMVATIIVFLASATLCFYTMFLLRYENGRAEKRGDIANFTYQMMSGLIKIRACAAEVRAFSRWAEFYSEQKDIGRKSHLWTSTIEVSAGIYPIISAILLMAAVALGIEQQWLLIGVEGDQEYGSNHMSLGDYVAFQLAFGQFSAGFLGLMMALIRVAQAIPLATRSRLLLHQSPERQDSKAETPLLYGKIEIVSCSFGYVEHLPPAVNQVSATIEPGEFVAIVGPSGSGKSTLLKLILGFETPQTGQIFFDDLPLTSLDLSSLRRQIGAVFPTPFVAGEPILHHLIGNQSNAIDLAWHVAEIVGLADAIRQLPMGIYTRLQEGGGGLSHGQRQRLQLARALAQKPKILLLDEATNALDIASRKRISEQLARLAVTRLVIAHNLETIAQADRILVLDQGRLVEQGNYDQLMNNNGLFRKLSNLHMWD